MENVIGFIFYIDWKLYLSCFLWARGKKDKTDEFFIYYKHESKFAKRPKKYAHERFKGKTM